jgi:AcrR family transcriptional regulator
MIIQVNPNIYLKNPESSQLGQRIVSGSIELIDQLGFEACTFKKLANHIDSTEASIYRYFDGKHKLLLYLTAWYWGWMEYRLVFRLANIDDPRERLMRAIQAVTEEIEEDSSFSHINEVKLNRLVIAEASKAYLIKDVDAINKLGIFSDYKRLVERISAIILEVNPEFKYPHMLVSTVIEGAHYQRFFKEHLPKLTDVLPDEDAIVEFYKNMVFQTIQMKTAS